MSNMSLRRNAPVQAQRPPPHTRLQAVLRAGIGMHAGMPHRDVTTFIALPEELQRMWLEKVGLTPGNEHSMTRIAFLPVLQEFARTLETSDVFDTRDDAVQSFFMNVCMLLDPTTPEDAHINYVDLIQTIKLQELQEPEGNITVGPPRAPARSSTHATRTDTYSPKQLQF
tara:strand:- start:1567 stop:2076 length:510 start_codon:yes stop_codon:yes gene_type:complete